MRQWFTEKVNLSALALVLVLLAELPIGYYVTFVMEGRVEAAETPKIFSTQYVAGEQNGEYMVTGMLVKLSPMGSDLFIFEFEDGFILVCKLPGWITAKLKQVNNIVIDNTTGTLKTIDYPR